MSFFPSPTPSASPAKRQGQAPFPRRPSRGLLLLTKAGSDAGSPSPRRSSGGHLLQDDGGQAAQRPFPDGSDPLPRAKAKAHMGTSHPPTTAGAEGQLPFKDQEVGGAG